MADIFDRALRDELVFLEAWETSLVPIVSGLTRVRQFQRANTKAEIKLGHADVVKQEASSTWQVNR